MSAEYHLRADLLDLDEQGPAAGQAVAWRLSLAARCALADWADWPGLAKDPKGLKPKLQGVPLLRVCLYEG